MSWKSGNQPTKTVLESWENPARIILSLWIRFPWLTSTPLGDPVEPEVY